jgi:hypothetical protein
VEYDMDEQGTLALTLALTHLLMMSTDDEWLKLVNAERKAQTLDTVSLEAFEIIMDRVEKEYFALVSSTFAYQDCGVETEVERWFRRRTSLNQRMLFLQTTPPVLFATMQKERT